MQKTGKGVDLHRPFHISEKLLSDSDKILCFGFAFRRHRNKPARGIHAMVWFMRECAHTYKSVFSKFGPHFKIQFESSTSFTRRITGKTGEIALRILQ